MRVDLLMSTAQDNIKHGFSGNGRVIWNKGIKTGTGKKGKTVLSFTKEGEFVKEYPNAMTAQLEDGYNAKAISGVCMGSKKSHKNLIWKYKDTE